MTENSDTCRQPYRNRTRRSGHSLSDALIQICKKSIRAEINQFCRIKRFCRIKKWCSFSKLIFNLRKIWLKTRNANHAKQLLHFFIGLATPAPHWWPRLKRTSLVHFENVNIIINLLTLEFIMCFAYIRNIGKQAHFGCSLSEL